MSAAENISNVDGGAKSGFPAQPKFRRYEKSFRHEYLQPAAGACGPRSKGNFTNARRTSHEVAAKNSASVVKNAGAAYAVSNDAFGWIGEVVCNVDLAEVVLIVFRAAQV